MLALPVFRDFHFYFAHRLIHVRSLYVYVLIYNCLPQVLVDLPSVAMFQAKIDNAGTR